MSDKNKNNEFFSNEDTLMRRAWIDSAIEGVRASLSSGAMEFGEPVNSPAGTAAGQRVRKTRAGRPQLYVAWAAGARRARF